MIPIGIAITADPDIYNWPDDYVDSPWVYDINH
jgi:hypothetical protein